jgi:hypothetical protein
MEDITTPVVFILVGVITSYYNKNMVVILLISLLFSNIVKYGMKITIDEGFTDTKNQNDKNPKENTADKTTKQNEKTNENPTEDAPDDTDNTEDIQNDPPKKAKSTDKKNNKDVSKKTKDELKKTQESYENLYSLQTQIKKSMDTLNSDLTNAEKIVENMKSKITQTNK